MKMKEIELLMDITPPQAKRCNIITIDDAPILAIYDFKGDDFQIALSSYIYSFLKKITIEEKA